ncbi:MAG: hypothetical protein AAF394_08215 [Planctomycetota bacterium]
MKDDLLQILLEELALPEDGCLGKYKVRSLLGRGGMGFVCAAFDDRLQREVALKFLSPALAANDLARERFLAEARAVANLRHENIVSVF